MTTNGLRMILAEDDLLLRAGLASLLERSGFQVVGQAGDTSALLALVDTHDPRAGGGRHPHAPRPHH